METRSSKRTWHIDSSRLTDGCIYLILSFVSPWSGIGNKMNWIFFFRVILSAHTLYPLLMIGNVLYVRVSECVIRKRMWWDYVTEMLSWNPSVVCSTGHWPKKRSTFPISFCSIIIRSNATIQFSSLFPCSTVLLHSIKIISSTVYSRAVAYHESAITSFPRVLSLNAVPNCVHPRTFITRHATIFIARRFASSTNKREGINSYCFSLYCAVSLLTELDDPREKHFILGSAQRFPRFTPHSLIL